MMTNTERHVLDALTNAPAITTRDVGPDVVRTAAADFADVFCLPQGVIASISRRSSYVSDSDPNDAVLYTYCLCNVRDDARYDDDFAWLAYAKGSTSELRTAARRFTRADFDAFLAKVARS